MQGEIVLRFENLSQLEEILGSLAPKSEPEPPKKATKKRTTKKPKAKEEAPADPEPVKEESAKVETVTPEEFADLATKASDVLGMRQVQDLMVEKFDKTKLSQLDEDEMEDLAAILKAELAKHE